MKVHTLKINIDPLVDVMVQDKKAECRKLDRDFAVGDLLMLTEYPCEGKAPRTCARVITHIQTGLQYGIAAGYGILSMRAPTAAEKRTAKDKS